MLSGLRYSDLAVLSWLDIESGYITIQSEKTDEIINIPITEKAARIISLQDKTKRRIFKIPSNQKYNDHLKLVALYCKISKRLTSHVGRHTFATISIELGIPIEIISKILGHQEIKTTKIYTKILNPLLKEYMNKWN
jgi:integrase